MRESDLGANIAQQGRVNVAYKRPRATTSRTSTSSCCCMACVAGRIERLNVARNKLTKASAAAFTDAVIRNTAKHVRCLLRCRIVSRVAGLKSGSCRAAWMRTGMQQISFDLIRASTLMALTMYRLHASVLLITKADSFATDSEARACS